MEQVVKRKEKWNKDLEGNRLKQREWANKHFENEKNKEKRRKRSKAKREKNIQHYRTYANKYQREKAKKDPNFRLARNLRKRFANAIKGTNYKKISALELCGCEIDFLKKYLESQFIEGMTWENYGKKWQIDHRLPVCSFDLSKLENQKACFHYSNLQPLWSRDNAIKGQKDKKLKFYPKISGLDLGDLTSSVVISTAPKNTSGLTEPISPINLEFSLEVVTELTNAPCPAPILS